MGNDSPAAIRGICRWLVRLNYRFRPPYSFVVIRRNALLELRTNPAGSFDVRHCGSLRPPSNADIESTGPVFHGSWPMAGVAGFYRSNLSVLPGEAVLPLARSMGMGIAN